MPAGNKNSLTDIEGILVGHYTDTQAASGVSAVICQMAHDGMARAIRPSHMMFDGDTIFPGDEREESSQRTGILCRTVSSRNKLNRKSIC